MADNSWLSDKREKVASSDVDIGQIKGSIPSVTTIIVGVAAAMLP